MSKFLIDKYASLEAYTPGEQPRDMKYVKLNTNESPYPASKGVVESVSGEEVARLNLYPDPECKALKEKLAEYYGVGYENVFVSNGSDEILSFAFMAFCSEQTGAVFPNISYGFYKVYGDLYNVDYTQAKLKSDFTIDVNDYINVGRTVVIANPNAPTGLSISPEDIGRICESNPDNVVLIDEAYVDFGGKSCVGLIDKYDNLLVVRTYSKSRSMAGARLGFAFASKGITDDLNRIKYSTNPYNINRLTLIAGAAAIDDCEYYKECCKKIVGTREYAKARLASLGFEYLDSDANFIFAKNSRIDGGRLYRELKKNGVLVRHFSDPLISDYVRITVGTREQMDTLFEKTEKILSEV